MIQTAFIVPDLFDLKWKRHFFKWTYWNNNNKYIFRWQIENTNALQYRGFNIAEGKFKSGRTIALNVCRSDERSFGVYLPLIKRS